MKELFIDGFSIEDKILSVNINKFKFKFTVYDIISL